MAVKYSMSHDRAITSHFWNWLKDFARDEQEAQSLGITHIPAFLLQGPYCPRAARLAHKLAIENEHIIADVVEVSEFIDMAQRYQVRSVPKTVVNDAVEFTGALPEPRFLQEVLKAVEPKQEQP